MDDDDEFDEFDDLDVDEAVLFAALQATEERYTLTSSSQAPPPQQPVHAPIVVASPPRIEKPNETRSLRRFRKSVPRQRPPVIAQDDDSFPEISLRADGTYSVQGTPVDNSTHRIPPKISSIEPQHPRDADVPSRPSVDPPPRTGSPQKPEPMVIDDPPAPPPVPVPVPKSMPVPRPANARPPSLAPPSRAALQMNRTNSSNSISRSASPIPSQSTARAGMVRTTSARAVVPSSSQQRKPRDPSAPSPSQILMQRYPEALGGPRASSSANDSELARLKRQLAEAQAAKDTAQRDLAAATDAQFAREGEVATLRRAMERQAAAHMEAINRLREEKTSFETTRSAMEASLRGDVDRLRSQLVFKQQELEASAVRFPIAPPSTTRRKRTVPQSQSSFMDTPTPGVRRPMNLGEASPSKRTGSVSPLKARKNSRNANPPGALHALGFRDSFSIRGIKPQNAQDNAKGKSVQTRVDEPRFEPSSPPQPGPSKPSALADGNLASKDAAPLIDADSIFSDGPAMPRNPSQAEWDPPIIDDAESVVSVGLDEAPQPKFRRLTQSEELYRLLFTHCTPSSTKSSIQILCGVTIESGGLAQTHMSACDSVLSAFGTLESPVISGSGTSDIATYQPLADAIGKALLQIAFVLINAHLYSPLRVLLELIQALVLQLSYFRGFFLSTSLEQEPNSTILCLLTQLIQPPEENGESRNPSQASALPELLGVVEALNWNSAETANHHFQPFLQSTDTWMGLLRSDVPLETKARAVRLLVALGSRRDIQLPFIPTVDSVDQEPSPVVNRILELLYESEPKAPRLIVCHLRLVLLTFLALLCVVHNLSSLIVKHHPTLLRALMACVSEAGTLLYNDDSFSKASPEEHHAVIESASASLHVLHQLFDSDVSSSQGQNPPPDLPVTLHNASSSYVSIADEFVVYVSRLGYADLPHWLGRDEQWLLEDLQDVARDLLDRYIEGPEVDLIVSAYQVNEDDSIRLTQEEVSRVEETDEEMGDLSSGDEVPVMDLDP